MIPLIAVVGHSKSGKTTLVEKIISELTRRGYRVASVKHAQEIHFAPGKDSERHLLAGSLAVGLLRGDQLVTIRSKQSEKNLEEITSYLGNDFDIIIAEGFKKADCAKILIHRAGTRCLAEELTQVKALASDEPIGSGLPVFDLNDYIGIADYIEDKIIKGSRYSGDKITKFPKI